jgi:hypothetical protein
MSTNRSGFHFRVAAACIAYAFAGSGAGCAATVSGETATSVDGYDAVYVDDAAVPASIEAYPHYYYGDGYAYYVNGRWYHRHGNRWVTYRHAPPELERQRVHSRERPINAAPAERQGPLPRERER